MPGGRPAGSGALTADQLRAIVLGAAAECWHASPTRGPSMLDVAMRLGLSENGLAKALRRHALAWRELRDESFRRELPA